MLQVPITLGRDLDAKDDAGSPRVALINQTLATQMFKAQNPVGARVRLNGKEMEIVGVAKDIRVRISRESIGPAVFIPYLQNLPPTVTFMVRSSIEPTALVNPIREAVRQIDPNLPIYGIETQNEEIESGFAIERMFASSAGFFGSVALLLACIGLYGLMSYSVERRTNEFGIRMALGASPVTVVQLVMRQTLVVVLAGIALGFAASRPIVHAIASMRILFKVESGDSTSYAIAIGTMIVVACLAAWLPARRAARVDPSVALRCE
jgi:ABC-type antimicrobial peptide transport system permease subunit